MALTVDDVLGPGGLVAQGLAGYEQRAEQLQLALADIRIALANTNPTGQLPELIPKMHFDYWAAPHGWACSLLIEAAIALRSITERAGMAFDAERARIRRRAPSR